MHRRRYEGHAVRMLPVDGRMTYATIVSRAYDICLFSLLRIVQY